MIADGEVAPTQPGGLFALGHAPESVSRPPPQRLDQPFPGTAVAEDHQQGRRSRPKQSGQALGERRELAHTVQPREIGERAVEWRPRPIGQVSQILGGADLGLGAAGELGGRHPHHRGRRVGQQDLPPALHQPERVSAGPAADLDQARAQGEGAFQFRAHGAPLGGDAEPRGEPLIEALGDGLEGCGGRGKAPPGGHDQAPSDSRKGCGERWRQASSSSRIQASSSWAALSTSAWRMSRTLR